MTLNQVLKYIPLLSGLLIFLGVLKLEFYYGYFGIEIISYLEITDILVAFLKDLNSVIIISVIGVLHLSLTDLFYNSIDIERFELVILKFRKFYRVFFLLSTIVFSTLLYLETVPLNWWSIYLDSFFIIQLLTFISISPRENNKEIEIKGKIFLTTIITIILLAIIPLLAISKAKSTLINKPKVVLIDSENKLIDQCRAIYLGKEGDFHFLYNRATSESIILKHEDVSRVIIKK